VCEISKLKNFLYPLFVGNFNLVEKLIDLSLEFGLILLGSGTHDVTNVSFYFESQLTLSWTV